MQQNPLSSLKEQGLQAIHSREVHDLWFHVWERMVSTYEVRLEVVEGCWAGAGEEVTTKKMKSMWKKFSSLFFPLCFLFSFLSSSYSLLPASLQPLPCTHARPFVTEPSWVPWPCTGKAIYWHLALMKEIAFIAGIKQRVQVASI